MPLQPISRLLPASMPVLYLPVYIATTCKRNFLSFLKTPTVHNHTRSFLPEYTSQCLFTAFAKYFPGNTYNNLVIVAQNVRCVRLPGALLTLMSKNDRMKNAGP